MRQNWKSSKIEKEFSLHWHKLKSLSRKVTGKNKELYLEEQKIGANTEWSRLGLTMIHLEKTLDILT